MYRVFKLVSRITIIIFIGMLLYVYAYLPEVVKLYIDDNDVAIIAVGKEQFFYGCLGIFVVCTLILSYLKKSLQAIPLTNSKDSISEAKKEGLQSWAHSLSVVLYLFFTATIAFIGMYHNSEHFNISNFAFLIYIGPVLLLGWIFYLPILLFSKS
ncbi:MAG: hypothetical protein ACJA2S_002845 [Cyclobacteriaceae bacterium]|jgi:hypothetical protein